MKQQEKWYLFTGFGLTFAFFNWLMISLEFPELSWILIPYSSIILLSGVSIGSIFYYEEV